MAARIFGKTIKPGQLFSETAGKQQALERHTVTGAESLEAAHFLIPCVVIIIIPDAFQLQFL